METIHEVRREDTGRGFLNLSKSCLIWAVIAILFAPVACVGGCVVLGGIGAAGAAVSIDEEMTEKHEAAGHAGNWGTCDECATSTVED